MKKLMMFFCASVLGGAFTLATYTYFIEDDSNSSALNVSTNSPKTTPVSYDGSVFGTNSDFTEAAEKTVNAVVHVKNLTVVDQPRNLFEYYFGGRQNEKALQGIGSGVIISPDGYIVTNYHVVKDASEIEITLNDNQTYQAEIMGADTRSDIALLKIDAADLHHLPFGNSNNVRIGEWVLAVGNPFNLTSTVTAGIVSATARDLDPMGSPQSFIQTDAAINPGNSGGALVNVRGELIGINTAITSQTGSYIGYGFAVPSNNARKIVEDIMEFGNVQQVVLGIRGRDVNSAVAEEFNLSVSQGVYIGQVDPQSGAAKAGIREGDVIRQVDDREIRKMGDLISYIRTKRPGDVVDVKLIRNGRERNVSVTLTEYETYVIESVGLEVTNASQQELQQFQAGNGVRVSRAISRDQRTQAFVGLLITKIDEKRVSSVEDVRRVMNQRDRSEPLSITFRNTKGEEQTYIWR